MMRNLYGLGWRSIAIGSILISGTITLNSCGQAQVAEKAAGVAPTSNSSDTSKPQESAAVQTQTPQTPQLVRTAELSLRLESIDKAMVQLRQIVRSKQGDIYDFQDDRLPENGRNHQATLMLKVPSVALENTLAEITKLGRVENQGIKSEDVSQQLVDTDARLKNLRQQEDLTRKIMDRSGSVKDILAVSKELAAIRDQIERLDATVKNLRQQVAYSTINLKSEIATASIIIHELLYGCLRLPESRKRQAFLAYINDSVLNLPIFDYDSKAAQWHAQERARLSKIGKTLAFADGQIASIASVNSLILVTNNVADFQHFENLEIENWFDSEND